VSDALSIISKHQLIQDVKQAIEEKKGFAMGKMGFSEQFILGYLPFLKSNPAILKIKAYETMLKYHCEIQSGVFPTHPDFLKEFAKFYTACAQSIDIIGIFEVEQEKNLIAQNNITAKLIPYQETEPDRSIPEHPSNCYLPFLVNRKILIISPFAKLLKERSQKEIFENVWSKIQKKWFYPLSVEALEIPYSYGSSTATHQKFGTSLNLYQEICKEIDQHEFDVVLMGVGALGFPLASYVKSKGKVAISLGGHLQVLFGVNGSRWKSDEYWNTYYFNDAWIDVPQKYHPKNREGLTDNGAYW
jgi:hypothetical protein